MSNCPYFDCLAYSPAHCDKYEGCVGCPKLSSCDHCSRKSAVVDGTEIPCPHKEEIPTER